jgi:hypothetical protein
MFVLMTPIGKEQSINVPVVTRVEASLHLPPETLGFPDIDAPF